MEGWNVFDISPFFLFEASGDSEPNSDLNMGAITDQDMDFSDDHNDAQSCICELSDDVRLNELNYFDYYNQEHEREDINHEDEEDDQDEDEEEEGVINQKWRGDKVVVLQNGVSSKKSKGCVDSSLTVEVMNERDTANRLFWETCLAS